MMKTTIVKCLSVVVSILGLSGCQKEAKLNPEWKYGGPIPIIEEGSTPAQKSCYTLYQKYDIHAYYTLSGDEALQTYMGSTQINPIISNNAAALPMQVANEGVATSFFFLLEQFYGLLPHEMVQKGLHKRQILVKVNAGNNRYKDEAGNPFLSFSFTEDQKGVIYYGYQKNANDNYDRFDAELRDWKKSIVYEFFRGLSFTMYKGIPLPPDFGNISKGLYYYENTTGNNVTLNNSGVFNREIGLKSGFIHPFGVMSSSTNPYSDWASWVTWILTEPLAKRQLQIDQYPKVKQKYHLILTYYKEHYDIGLEELSPKIQEITNN